MDVDQLLATFDGLVPAVLVLIPVAAGTAGISLMLRGSYVADWSWRAPLVDALLMYSGLLAAFLVFSPQSHSADDVQLEPGNDLVVALQAAPGDLLPWIQLVGNFLLLLPLGALIPLRVRWFRQVTRIALGGLLVACVIEIVQFVAVSGRVVSTDDVVLNTIGATCGGVLTLPLRIRDTQGLVALPEHRPVVRVHRAPRAQHGCAEGQETTVWGLIAKVESERRHGPGMAGQHVSDRRHSNETATETSGISRRPSLALAGLDVPSATRPYGLHRSWPAESEAVAS